MKTIENIEEKLSRLSPESIDELEKYLDFLIHKNEVNSKRKLRQDWAGSLRDISDSAIELQKKVLTWRKQ